MRDKERREVDFVVTERRRPYLLVEAKLADAQIAPSLRYFRDRLGAKHAIQVVRRGPPRKSDGILLLPADRLLARM